MTGKAIKGTSVLCGMLLIAIHAPLIRANAQTGNRGINCSWSINLRKSIVGTWSVENFGAGTTGQVTFAADGSYTIDSGIYNAGGSFAQATSGAYEILPGEAIAFTYSDATIADRRIAVVQCASRHSIAHFVMGHTHDYEVLTRVR